MSRHTAAEGRELKRRLLETRAKGGASQSEVERETRDEMEKDLRQMVRAYKGAPRQAKELLEALVIARDYGVAACDEIERELAERLRKPRAG